MQQSELLKAINQGKITSMQIGVIVICWFINMLDGFDVLAIAYTAPSITEEWALAPERLGVVLSASLVGMAPSRKHDRARIQRGTLNDNVPLWIRAR